MSYKKGIAREVGSDFIASGKLHMPDLRFITNAQVYEGGEISREHLDAIHESRPVVHQSHVDIITSALDAVTLNKIVEQRRSAHGVGFGSLRMLGRTAAATSEVRTQERHPVALKPFDDPESALHEMYGYGVLKSMGIETFEPIGVFPAREGSHQVLVSEKRNDLMSLDRDTWVVGGYAEDQESARTVERNCEIVQAIAEKLGYMHVNGIFHPDGQIKNWAITPEGEIGVIDTENLIVQTQSDDISDIVSLVWYDIEKLTKSLIFSNSEDETKIFGVGMLANMPAQRARSQLEMLLITPYINSLFSHALHDNASTDALNRAEKLITGIQQHFENNPNWPAHLVSAQRLTMIDLTEESAVH